MSHPQLIKAISGLHVKIENLLREQSAMRTRIEELERENRELREDRSANLREIEKGRQQIEFLSMSHRLADTAENIISTRRHLAKLIRTIDNCIRMINED